MPKRKGYKRRRPFKKRVNRPGKALSVYGGVYKFTRETDELVPLAGTPDGWTLNADNTLARTFAYSLSTIGDRVDFQNLFKYFRIKGARVRMYFSNTGSTSSTQQNPAISPYVPNSQIMIQLDKNQDGVSVPNINSLLASQTKRRFVALHNTRKPSVDIYMPLKQAVNMFADSGAPTALTAPKWLNTQDGLAAQVPHYGLNINLGRMDRQGFTSGITNSQYVRIITTLYIECRKVQ